MLTRAATPHDLESVRRIENHVFGGESYPGFFFRQALDLWGELLRVADGPAGVVGYVLGATSHRVGEAWILSAAVSPAYRGKGIATKMTEELLAVLARLGIHRVSLTVHPANRPAIATYRKLGFAPLGEDAEYFGPGAPRILMRLGFGPGEPPA